MTAQDKSDKTRKPRWSKNKKRNWRRRIDISEVEDGLDKSRLEQRTGGLVKNKANHELFFIEKKSGDTGLTHRQRRKEKRLTADKIIRPNPDEVLPSSRRNIAKLRRKEKHLNLMTKLQIYPRKRKTQVNKSVKKSNDMDIWSYNPRELTCNLFGKNDVTVHTETIIGEAQVKRPKHLFSKPATDAKAVEVAHAGASYNPTFEDHQNLLLAEHKSELAKCRETERIERSVMVDASTIATAESKEKELTEGLFIDGNDSGVHEDETDEDDDLNNINISVGKPMTKKQRKELARKQIEDKEKSKDWADKLRQNEVYRIKTFLSEIQEKERQIEAKKKRKMERKKQPMLSSTKFVEPDHDLQLSSEIRGSLRQLKPEGNLMVDRYKSLQKRCIIEPKQRFKPPRRKYKVKYQEKRTFREIEI
uniref:Ribosome biogenesis protein NOP53 n=1 Tax=Phallusia mammillata TaxID=59560 RepID=A0A6F9DEK0_9ASCI|nr:glioma tumor suppressor candidate region gene 2 protein-like [Phallusia mammillata]